MHLFIKCTNSVCFNLPSKIKCLFFLQRFSFKQVHTFTLFVPDNAQDLNSESPYYQPQQPIFVLFDETTYNILDDYISVYIPVLMALLIRIKEYFTGIINCKQMLVYAPCQMDLIKRSA